MSKRHTKGQPTSLNLSVLADHFGWTSPAGTTRPNRVEPTSAPHLRRCLKAGLVSVAGSSLVLTEAGSAALYAEALRLAAFPYPPSEVAWAAQVIRDEQARRARVQPVLYRVELLTEAGTWRDLGTHQTEAAAVESASAWRSGGSEVRIVRVGVPATENA